jgi:hypothetical protein
VSILNALSRDRHLDDDQLVDVWTARSGGEPVHPNDAHLADCGQCRARYDAFSGWMDGVQADAVSEADDLFPPERLTAQQAQILRRLEALERPARVIAFPRFVRPTAVVRRGPQRWIAAAAAAGLIVGLGAGELLDFRRSLHGGDVTARRVSPAPHGQTARGLQPISLSSDDSFLYDDTDTAAPRVEALQALDALTPRVRDLDPSR